MALRFRRSFRIAPGIKLNLTRRGLGATVGVRGAHVSVNSNGRLTESVGAPGSGLYFQQSRRIGGGSPNEQAPEQSPEDAGSSEVCPECHQPMTPDADGFCPKCGVFVGAPV